MLLLIILYFIFTSISCYDFNYNIIKKGYIYCIKSEEVYDNDNDENKNNNNNNNNNNKNNNNNNNNNNNKNNNNKNNKTYQHKWLNSNKNP